MNAWVAEFRGGPVGGDRRGIQRPEYRIKVPVMRNDPMLYERFPADVSYPPMAMLFETAEYTCIKRDEATLTAIYQYEDPMPSLRATLQDLREANRELNAKLQKVKEVVNE